MFPVSRCFRLFSQLLTDTQTSVFLRVGYRFVFFRYRCQIDTFKTVPVPEPIFIKIKNYQLIIGLAISTKHMGPVSQTHRQGLD